MSQLKLREDQHYKGAREEEMLYIFLNVGIRLIDFLNVGIRFLKYQGMFFSVLIKILF